MYEGQLDEVRYSRLDDGSIPDRAVLKEFETVTVSAGEISYVYPPKADIHKVLNRTDQLAISVHVYGHDIGKHERHVYDLETSAIKHVVTAHVNEAPAYSSN
jgi:predicted metal-dependent enzyme (double-stranded beta helix superfamily)